jgi:hypothetical protein
LIGGRDVADIEIDRIERLAVHGSDFDQFSFKFGRAAQYCQNQSPGWSGCVCPRFARDLNKHSSKQKLSEDLTATLKAGRGPKLAGVIVRVKGRNTFGQHNPREFRADVNVHVRR